MKKILPLVVFFLVLGMAQYATAWNITIGTYDEEDYSTGVSNITLTIANATGTVKYYNLYLPNMSYSIGTAGGGPRIVWERNLTINDLNGVNSTLIANFSCVVESASYTANVTIRKNDIDVGSWIGNCNTTGVLMNVTSTAKFTTGDNVKIWKNLSVAVDMNLYGGWIKNLTFDSIPIVMENVSLNDNTLTFEKYGWGTRKRYANISNETNDAMSMYMLSNENGHSVSWVVQASDAAGNLVPLPGVVLTARKYLDDWRIVDQETTDDSGIANLWLSSESYEIEFNKTGCDTVRKNLTTSESTYIQTLVCAGAGNLSFDYEFRDVAYNITPKTLFDNTTDIIFTIFSKNSSLLYYGFNVTWNGTIIYSGNGTTPSGESLDAAVNLSNATGTFVTMLIWFLPAGNFTEMKFTLYSAVAKSYEPGGGEEAMKGIASELPLSARMVIALFLSLGIVIGFGRYSGMGAGIIVLVFLGILTYVGWFEGFGLWIPTYSLFIMTIFGIYMLKGER